MTLTAISAGTVLLVGGGVADLLGSRFPYGKPVINVAALLMTGVVPILSLERLFPDWIRPLLAIGILGS